MAADRSTVAFVYAPVFYRGLDQGIHPDALMHCEHCRLCRSCDKRLRWSLFRRLWVGHRFGCERRRERTSHGR